MFFNRNVLQPALSTTEGALSPRFARLVREVVVVAPSWWVVAFSA
jgi:hypothetical protein